MSAPGPRNSIADVDGILVGNAEDRRVQSGTTVLLCESASVAGIDVRGGAPGTRETDLLDPANSVEGIDALCFSGGSAFGLDAAGGVMDWLKRQGRGVAVGPARVPIVPGAIIFDLASPGDKDWGETPPYRALGRRAVEAAAKDFALGNAGAGMGARAGRIKGGLGSASALLEGGLQIGALVVANPVGGVLVPGTTTLWAWPFEQAREMGGQVPPVAPLGAAAFDLPLEGRLGGHTTIGAIATNAALTKAECRRLAIMAHDGFARAIRPVHTPFDGDTVFAVATGRGRAPEQPRGLLLARLGMAAADCMARAIGRAVYCAESLGDLPSYRSLLGRT